MDRQEAIKWLTNLKDDIGTQHNANLWHYQQALVGIIKLLATDLWIPFETKPLTEDEKTEHPEWAFVFEGEFPKDGQRILVNVAYKGHEAVQPDQWLSDADGYYLDSGYDIGTEVTAWMPMPEPWNRRENKQDER